MGITLNILVLFCVIQLCVCDLTCEGGGHRACDWSCRLGGRMGSCRWDTGKEQFRCDCIGEIVTDPDLFADGDDSNGGPEKGYLPSFLNQIVFFPFVRSYMFQSREDLAIPAKYGLENAENFYIATENGALGAWYLWPASTYSTYRPITSLIENSTLIIYMHGNSMDRGFHYRVGLYKVLTKMGFHLITFDYRSYGDSSRVELTEKTVVDDGKAVLRWVENLYKMRSSEGPNIIVWGHSLGTAVATRAVAEQDNKVSGLVLESPFNKMEDEVKSFKVATWTAWMTGIDIGEVLSKAEVQFLTEKYLPQIQAPTLVLHSDDDPMVPSYLGEKLFNSTIKSGKNNIQLVRYGKEHGLKHRYIYRAPGVENLLEEFVKKTEQFREDNY